MKSSSGERSETTGVGLVKQVGFKPGVKKEGAMDEQSGESKEKEVMGEGIGELEIEELVPEIEADEKILL